jgi:hypothetical protein
MYREKQIKLIGLNEHTQQIGSSQLADKSARMLSLPRKSAYYESYSDSALNAHAVLTFSHINFGAYA